MGPDFCIFVAVDNLFYFRISPPYDLPSMQNREFTSLKGRTQHEMKGAPLHSSSLPLYTHQICIGWLNPMDDIWMPFGSGKSLSRPLRLGLELGSGLGSGFGNRVLVRVPPRSHLPLGLATPRALSGLPSVRDLAESGVILDPRGRLPIWGGGKRSSLLPYPFTPRLWSGCSSPRRSRLAYLGHS